MSPGSPARRPAPPRERCTAAGFRPAARAPAQPHEAPSGAGLSPAVSARSARRRCRRSARHRPADGGSACGSAGRSRRRPPRGKHISICLYKLYPMEAPVLWHLKVSNYNEKARWALDYKRVPHVRRAVVPGRAGGIAKRLSGGRTFPILVLDGEPIGDTTDIIAALERLQPEPRLYPADPEERRRAVELEEFFDEELRPHARCLAMHHMLGS